MKNNGKPFKSILLAILSLTLASCLSRPEEKAPSSSAASTFANNIDYGAFVELGGYDGSVGTPDHYLHKAGYVDWTTGDVINDGTTECKIRTAEFSNPDSNSYNQQSDILCFLEANELDLAFYGAKVEVGFQPGMCEFVRIKPYWYWNFPPGTSNATVTQYVLGDEVTQCVTDQRATPLTENDIYGVAAIDRNFALYTNSTDAIESAKDLCLFDWSQRTNLTDVDEEEAPNCDNGRVTLLKSTCQDVEDELGNVTCECGQISEETVSCGGSWANCIEGPAKQYATSSDDFPVPIYRNSLEDGYLSRFNLGNTDTQLIGRSYSIRNLANWTRTATSEDDQSLMANGQQWYPSLLPQTIRYNVHKLRDYASRGSRIRYSREEALTALQNTIDGSKNLTGITDAGGGGLYAPISMTTTGTGGDGNPPTAHGANLSYTMAADPRQSVYKDGITPNPFYTWECLNRAEEVKARIRIMIRPWNETFQAVDASSLSRVFPLDSNNYHRADTGFKEDIPIFSTADFYDWDDAYEFSFFSDDNLGEYDTDLDFDDFASTFAPTIGAKTDAPYWKDNVCYNSGLTMSGTNLDNGGNTCLRYPLAFAAASEANVPLYHQHAAADNVYFENLRLEWPNTIGVTDFGYPKTSDPALEDDALDQYPYVNSVPPGYDFLLGFTVTGDLSTAYDGGAGDTGNNTNARASLGTGGANIEAGTGTDYPFTAPRYYEARFNFPLVIGLESEFTEDDILDEADDEDSDDDGDDG